MTTTAWRLVKWAYRTEAFSGVGSYKYGNRWNSPGRRVAYLADTQALAALETVAHFRKGETPPAFAFLAVDFNSKFVQVLETPLPPNWATMPLVTAVVGDEWYDAGSSCILAIPTALVPNGTNYLVNIMHRDFPKVKRGQPHPFGFDQRITHRVTPSSPG